MDATASRPPDLRYSKLHFIPEFALSNCFAIEEKYEILVSNYLEFEKQILNSATSYMVRSQMDYSDSFETKLRINISLVNLLTTARLYIDQLSQNVQKCVPEQTDIKKNIKKLFAQEYDSNFEYRFMEALRNYVQHRGIPLHWLSKGGEWTSLDDNGLLEYSVEIASLRSDLAEDGNFKKSVLNEADDKIDLKTATRCYLESLSNVHDSARHIIEPSVRAARDLLEDAHRQYASIYSESLVGLNACIWSEGQEIEYVPLLLDWDDIRIKLQKRNGKLTNLRKRYVTGKVKSAK